MVINLQKVQKLEDKLSKATEAFVEQLEEMSSLHTKAQESLEREQARCTGLEQETVLNQDKVEELHSPLSYAQDYVFVFVCSTRNKWMN